jgi:peptidoglycan/LPS O-acetylase OafA/YrhL
MTEFQLRMRLATEDSLTVNHPDSEAEAALPPLVVPRRPSWELLAVVRFFLAAVVVSSHLLLFATTPAAWARALDAFGGKAAVVGFLLVSGYSISASLRREQRGFYRRRFLRVYPLYFTALVFATVLQHVTSGTVTVQHTSFVALGALTTIGNFLLLQTFAVKPLVFDGPVWSLAVEVFFYALAPFLARRSRGALMVLVVLSCVSFMLPKRDDLGLPYFIMRLNAFRYLWCWLLGFLIERNLCRPVVGLAVAAAILMPFGHDTPEPLAVLTYLGSLGALLGARYVTFPARLRAGANYLGDLSYPLYLFHFPAFIAGYALFGLRSTTALVTLALLTTILANHLVDGQLKRRLIAPLLFRRPTAVA